MRIESDSGSDIESDIASEAAPDAARDTDDRHRLVVVATPGVPLFELAIAVEVFGRDRRDLTPRWYRFALAGVEPRADLAHGVALTSLEDLAALAQADTIVVPACADVHEQSPPALLDALRAAHERGARIAAICSGAFVLAQAGLLDGRRATTHWMHAGELARRHPTVRVDPAVLYVHDDVWTSAGSSAGMDMCLELVRRDFGAGVANEVARRVVAPPHREGGQAQFVRPGAQDRLAERPDVMAWARDNLPVATVVGMADHAGVSGRTLHRQFRDLTGAPPQLWLQRQRLDAAAELLETTDLTVAAIARQTGLGTAANLRSRFARVYGVPPARYRGTFARPDARQDR